MRRAVLVAALLLSARPLPAAITWYDAYDRGVKAVQARQWTVAEKYLKDAAPRARPGRQVRTYGTHFITFLPNYYLGIVYFNQQRYREAQEELQRVEASGLVAVGDPEHPNLVELLGKANEKVREAAAPPPTTVPPPKPADLRIAEARRMLEKRNLEAARRALEDARALEPEHTDLKEVEEAIQRAETAERAAAREAEQRKRLEAALVAGAAARYQDPDSRQAARDALQRARSFGVTDSRVDDLKKRLDVLDGLAELAGQIGRREIPAARRKASDLARLDARHPDLVQLQGELERLVAADNERAGVGAFFRGQYETAIDLLAARPQADSPRAQFYLACSNAALGLLKGADAGGEPFLARARSLFARVRSAKPRVPEKERRLISPRIRHLFEAS